MVLGLADEGVRVVGVLRFEGDLPDGLLRREILAVGGDVADGAEVEARFVGAHVRSALQGPFLVGFLVGGVEVGRIDMGGFGGTAVPAASADLANAFTVELRAFGGALGGGRLVTSGHRNKILLMN